jgi:hypothetical protein
MPHEFLTIRVQMLPDDESYLEVLERLFGIALDAPYWALKPVAAKDEDDS